VVFEGDSHQTLPMISKGICQQVIVASLLEEIYGDILSSYISDTICTWATLKPIISMLSGCWKLVLDQL